MTRTRLLTPLAVGTLALAACGSDAPADIDFSALDDAIDETLDEVDFDENDTEVDCPVDDWDDIVRASVDGLDEDIVEAALDGDRDEGAFESAGERFIDCGFFEEDEPFSGVGLFMLETPRDPDEFAEEFAGEDARVDIDETNEYRGGQFRHVCVDYPDDDSGYCQVEWLGDEVTIAIFVTGDRGDRIDTDALEEAFTPQLDLIAEQFAP